MQAGSEPETTGLCADTCNQLSSFEVLRAYSCTQREFILTTLPDRMYLYSSSISMKQNLVTTRQAGGAEQKRPGGRGLFDTNSGYEGEVWF